MTYFLWLFAGLALAVTGLVTRRHRRRAGGVMVGLGTIICLAAIGWQVRTFVFSPASPAIDRYHATVAYFLAQGVLEETRTFSGPVYLLLPPDRRGNQRQLDSLFDTFARVFAPVPDLVVRDVVVVASEQEIRGGKVTAAVFSQALAAATGAVACVSFVGWPADFEPPSPGPATPRPLLFVFDPSGGTTWRVPLARGQLRRVIVPRPDADAPGRAGPTGPPDELFERFFLLARPATADAVARQLGARP
ncbi:MAG: hypothetical protein HS113_09920 [Verrucomicrobiales bacterium]|nr:hypothetical protein [Verrucomicrobiales bacterium]